MIRRSGRWVAVLTAAVMLVTLAGPAMAQQDQYGQYGRTYGGYAGAGLGALAGGSLGTAAAAAAGVTNPLLGGAIIAGSAVGAGYLGSRAGSLFGNELDHRFTARQVWTTVGALTGGLAGFVLMPAGGIVGKIVAGAVGAAIGGWIGDKLSGKAARDYNPRTVGAVMGGVNGALLGGPLGAAVGVPVGYVAGDIFDRHIFTEPNRRLRDWRERDTWVPRAPRSGEDGDGRDDDGYDRAGYDRQGYDRNGYDREGYDREGYDRDGVDRQGYDRNGFFVGRASDTGSGGEGAGSTGGTGGTTNTYDPSIYNDYWERWRQMGGRYPDFEEGHWNFFPSGTREDQRIRYEARFRRRMRVVIEGELPADATMEDIRRAYDDAVREFQRLARENAPLAQREAALAHVSTLEREMQQKIRAHVTGR